MELQHLKTFKAVASAGSFTLAGLQLSYAQSTVTAHIQSLEAEIGTSLFDRLGRKIALTDAGKRLLPYADRLLALAAEARDAVVAEDEPTGPVVISAPETITTYRLPAVLHRLRDLYPGISLKFRPVRVQELRRKVAEGVLDVAFVLERPIDPKGLGLTSLIKEPMVVVAHPRHPLTGLDSVQARDLAGVDVLFTEPGCSYRNQFEHALLAAGVYPSVVLEFSSIEAIKQCVIAGMGISVLPRVAVEDEIARGQLVALPWAGEPIVIETQMLWHTGKSGAKALQAFLAVATETMRAC